MKKRLALILGTTAAIALLAIAARPVFRRDLSSLYRSSTAVYARNGELLRLTLSNDQRYRQWVPLADISEKLKTSFLLSEDRYFHSHPGINPVSFLRAGWGTYVSGGRRGGASTITMQLARMLHRIHSADLTGKIQQTSLALWLEYLYSKDEILEAYLNLVPMGGNIEGVGAASLIFFGKRPSELSWAESLLLAVVPQNPNKRTLLKGMNHDLRRARDRLFTRASEVIPSREKDASLVDPHFRHLRDLPFSAPHFVLDVLGKFPGTAEVRTTLNLPLQKRLEKKLSSFIHQRRSLGVKNGAILLQNWQTGDVLAYVGSADFQGKDILGQVDGTRALRSPGSTLKPFIYGMAIEQGLIHPGTVLKDSPRAFGAYDPENFDGKFQGPLSAEVALNESRNLPAVELLTKLTSPGFYDFLVSSGAGTPRSRDFYGHALALGGYEVTLSDLVNLYSMLPRRGFFKESIVAERERKKQGEGRELLSAEASFLVLDMLSRAHLQSSRFHLLEKKDSFPVSWKTGTSSGFRDAWTIGVFGQYALGVWIGNFSGESNRAFVGRELAAPLFFELVDVVRLQQRISLSSLVAWEPPITVKKVDICPVSGKFPGVHCRHSKKVHFIPGTSPIEKCDVHRQIWVSSRDGKLSCRPDPKRDRPVIHEFWSSDILHIFRAAGLPRKPLPPPGPSCESLMVQDLRSSGRAPEILSPRENSFYSLRQSESSRQIPLQGNFDSSARELFWFVDNEFVGKSTGSAVLWKARAGTFSVTAIDDLGRATSRELQVQIVQ